MAGTGPSRRPTVVTQRRPSISYASPSVSSPTGKRSSGREDDDGLLMREKEREDGSIGKTGAIERGVTRPKRRLSSLPTLAHPFHSSNRSPNASPPVTPNGASERSIYHALNKPLSGPPPYKATKIDLNMTAKDSAPTIMGIELKWISLLTLALQNAFLTIIMHYSRISTAPNKTYSAAAAVLLNELLKGAVSIVIALKKIDVDMAASGVPASRDSQTFSRAVFSRLPSYLHHSRIQNLSAQVFSSDCYKLAVPAILYVIQNNLQYVAASNLDVATFQVTYQMKILTTAFFSVLMLRKRLSRTKWVALIMLAVGVGIVQIQSTSAPAHGTLDKSARSDIPEVPSVRVMQPFKGFIAVTLACMTSGLAGVYFEFILKSSSGSSPAPDLWVRNTQLSLFSLVPALVPILFGGSDQSGVGYVSGVIGKFRNFNGWAMGTVLTQTFGGLVTAVVIRYSDNIMKGFATSLSIIISFLASVALFSYPITLAFVVGSSIVLAATYVYNSPSEQANSRATVAVLPGSPIHSSAPILGEPERPSRASSVINLLGLGSSAAPSRHPSSSDLRTMGSSSNLGYMTPNRHIYAASAPGSPNLGGLSKIDNQSSHLIADYTDTKRSIAEQKQ